MACLVPRGRQALVARPVPRERQALAARLAKPQRQSPEFLDADDTGDRLARDAPPPEVFETLTKEWSITKSTRRSRSRSQAG